MSEYSLSFHIRTEDSVACEGALRKEKYSGLLFGPSRGWLTFVPFADEEAAVDPVGFAQRLAQSTGNTVLQYQYADDHLWSFAIVSSGSVARFSFGWDPKPSKKAEFDDLSSLYQIIPRKSIAKYLEPKRFDADGNPLAYGFADAIGLPAYRWVSPALVLKDTENFIARGWRRIGRKKPAREAQLKLPERTQIAIPGGWCTAREALRLLEPLIAKLAGKWILYSLSAQPLSNWQFRYFNSSTRDSIYSYIYSNGSAGLASLGRVPELRPITNEQIGEAMNSLRGHKLSKQEMETIPQRLKNPPEVAIKELPETWLDSDAIARIAKAVARPAEEPEAQATFYELSWRNTPEARWTVHCGGLIWNWTIELDAVDGAVLRETLGRWTDGEVKTYRERLASQEWHDV